MFEDVEKIFKELEVEEFNPNLIMVSFDAKSLFDNIPFTETIGLCVQNLYRNTLIVQQNM